MKIGVVGLTHLGAVTAACLAKMGHDVVAYEPRENIRDSSMGENLNLIEPGLWDLVKENSGETPICGVADRLADREVIWVCYETPIGVNGNPEPDKVMLAIEMLFPHFHKESLVVISSQLPVGSVRTISKKYSIFKDRSDEVCFVCIPENLRHGDAIQRFLDPDRVVVGLEDGDVITKVVEIFSPWCRADMLLWMSWEDAEMVKHAINAFLATEISFINEIGSLCGCVGADVKQVSRGLMTDKRIGNLAYLKAGSPFTERTLGRDIHYLRTIPTNVTHRKPTPVLDGVVVQNEMVASKGGIK